MSRRGDGIRKRKDGRWEGRYKRGRRPDGTIQYGSVYGRSYREVKDKLSEKRIELSDSISTKANHTTFGDLLKMWIHIHRLLLIFTLLRVKGPETTMRNVHPYHSDPSGI